MKRVFLEEEPEINLKLTKKNQKKRLEFAQTYIHYSALVRFFGAMNQGLKFEVILKKKLKFAAKKTRLLNKKTFSLQLRVVTKAS